MEKKIKIGWGKRSIAKEGPVPITGQFHLRISRGVYKYSSVEINALVIENGSDAVIFASADMVAVSPEVLLKAEEILKVESPELPAGKLIVNATHTHAGPASTRINRDYPPAIDCTDSDEMIEYLGRQLADAVKDAWQSRAYGSVAYGYGFATTGHSRRTVYLEDIGNRDPGSAGLMVNGRAKMYGITNDELFDGFEAGTDATINLLYTFDENEKITGAVINVPCPSQTNEHAWVLHGSFWHNVREKLSDKYGKNFGVIGQAAAAGDLSPRQLLYLAAEKRRLLLKYPDLVARYKQNPMLRANGEKPDVEHPSFMNELIEMLRAEDIANRITAAFDEVLSWAGKEKFSAPELQHEVRELQLSRRFFDEKLVEIEKQNYAECIARGFDTTSDTLTALHHNSRLKSQINRCLGVIKRAEVQQKEPKITTVLHAVKIGNVAFASNRFELFMDYMHRIQARSPFEQTFIVQLVVDKYGNGSYLATERGTANKGYSATPYCNQVSASGGQELVNATLETLNQMKEG